jgi:hypothetical protein
MGKTEVVDADLGQYFDAIPHCGLMTRIARQVRDGGILKLIKAWLRTLIVEEGNKPGIKANACAAPGSGTAKPMRNRNTISAFYAPLDGWRRAASSQLRQPTEQK